MFARIVTHLLFALALISTASAAEETATRGPIPIAEVARSTPVDFEKEILPLFRANCLSCHNATEAKGELILETPGDILKGGESGPAVVPGKGGESLLVKLAAHQEKPFMPPPKNKAGALPFTPEQLGLLQLWITQGATGVVSQLAGPINWRDLPGAIHSIDAVAISDDGQFAACNRGNKLFLYSIYKGELVATLSDPGIVSTSGPVADRDSIHSLAFSPDGTVLAAGGFRSIKFWKRQDYAAPREIALDGVENVSAISLSADKKTAAIGRESGEILLFDTGGWLPRGKLYGHTNAITSLVFSPDGQTLVSASADKTIRIWSPGTGGETLKKEFPSEAVALAFGPKGICAGFMDGKIQTLGADLNSVQEFTSHTGRVVSLSIASNLLLSGGANGSLKLWNIENGQLIREMAHGGEICAVSLRADGKRAASGGMDKSLKLWDVETGKLIAEAKGDPALIAAIKEKTRELEFAKSEVEYSKTSLQKAGEQEKAETEALKKATEAKEKAEKAFVDQSEALRKATEARDNAQLARTTLTEKVEEAKKQRPSLESAKIETASAVQRLQPKLDEARSAFEKAQTNREAIATRLINAAFRAKLAAIDLEEAKVANQETAAIENTIRERRALVETVAEELALAKDKAVQSQSEVAAIEKQFTESQQLAAAAAEAFTASEKFLADADNQLRKAGELVESTGKKLNELEASLKLAEGVRNGAVQSFESTTLVLARAKESVQKCTDSVQTSEQGLAQAEKALASAKEASLQSGKPVRSVQFSDDGTLYYGEEGGVVRRVDGNAARPLGSVSPGQEELHGLAGLPGGRLLAAGKGAKLRVIDPSRPWVFWKRIGDGGESSPLVDRVLALGFSPDGTRLASGGGFPSRSGELKIWDAGSSALLREIKDPHSDTVLALSWSHDQQQLASGGSDKFMRVFSMADGRLVKSFEGHTHHVLGVAWKRDGRTLASSGADKVVKIWEFATGEQRKTIEGFGKEATSIQFISVGGELLVSSGDSQVKLVREDGGQVRQFGGSADYVSAAAASAGGRFVVAGSLDGVLRVWNGATGELLHKFSLPVPAQTPAPALSAAH